MKKLILYIFFLFLSISSYGEIKLIFRYDDFILRKDSLNEKLVDLFIQNNVPLVLGVIPADDDEQLILAKDYVYLLVLKNAEKKGKVEIAMHGLNHNKLANGEFGGVDYKEQYRRINKGKHYLDSVFAQQTTTFIPPWNAYDSNTLKVLQKLNFNTISSALCEGQPFDNDVISFIPCTVEHPQELLTVLNNNKNRDGIVVLMFHRYDFDNQFTLTNIEQLIGTIKKMKFVQPVTFKQLYEYQDKVNGKTYKANLSRNFLKKELKLDGMIYSYPYLLIIRILNRLLYILVGLVLSTIVFFVCGRLNNRLSKKTITKTLVGLFVLFTILVWFNILSPLRLCMLVIGLSFVITIAICLFYKFVRK